MSDCISDHTIIITDRGGVTRQAQLFDVTSVEWGRDRDSVSMASVVITGQACTRQADTLLKIEPLRSEMVIFRGDDRVWEGPVWRVGWGPGYVEIAAHDIFEYYIGTPLTADYSNAYPNIGPVSTRIAGIVAAEMPVWEAQTPPANVLPYFAVHHWPNEANTSAATTAYQMSVGDHIQDLAQYSGVDYCVLGRALHIWDNSRSLGTIRTLTDADFTSGVVVTAYGSDYASNVYYVGPDGSVGHAGAPDPYYGPWTKFVTLSTDENTPTPTQAQLDSQAQRALTGNNPVPVTVRVPDNSGIILSDTLQITDLVPGAYVPLRATLNTRPLQQMQKIDAVTVKETAEGETVTMTLVPAGKADSDA